MTPADLLTVWTEKALPNRVLADSAISSHKWAIKILIEVVGKLLDDLQQLESLEVTG